MEIENTQGIDHNNHNGELYICMEKYPQFLSKSVRVHRCARACWQAHMRKMVTKMIVEVVDSALLII